ncbi:hypothetical protein BLNAU_18849 [Blattamonas nauphoetae]|uniref:Uncharacterized protein n=1 Tax=Blattamonas nauphoetae TaxID=2049346 RepID=A0ABQ9X3A8_9EUKA|nr:hypothetical protein BLNAU_18849 [Blattamonas nauphoetae]
MRQPDPEQDRPFPPPRRKKSTVVSCGFSKDGTDIVGNTINNGLFLFDVNAAESNAAVAAPQSEEDILPNFRRIVTLPRYNPSTLSFTPLSAEHQENMTILQNVSEEFEKQSFIRTDMWDSPDSQRKNKTATVLEDNIGYRASLLMSDVRVPITLSFRPLNPAHPVFTRAAQQRAVKARGTIGYNSQPRFVDVNVNDFLAGVGKYVGVRRTKLRGRARPAPVQPKRVNWERHDRLLCGNIFLTISRTLRRTPSSAD